MVVYFEHGDFIVGGGCDRENQMEEQGGSGRKGKMVILQEN